MMPDEFAVVRCDDYYRIIRVRPPWMVVACSVGDSNDDRMYLEWLAVLANKANSVAEE